MTEPPQPGLPQSQPAPSAAQVPAAEYPATEGATTSGSALLSGRSRAPLFIAVAAFVAAAVIAAISIFVGSRDKTPESGPFAGIDHKLDAFYYQKVSWGTCDGFEAGGKKLNYGLQCARIKVPVDYANPGDGQTAEIAISRARASGNKIGSLLMNPGGPGASGLRMATVGFATPLGQRFDVVGFDPRGIGASTPSIECFTDKEHDEDRAKLHLDNSPAGIKVQESDTQNYVNKCAERTGKEFLAHVGTLEVAKDMDVIRAVLGDDKLNYLGISYGTYVGSKYAELFPTRVRAMVLDGAVNPAQDQQASLVKQWKGFQEAFETYGKKCAEEVANCPLGNDPSPEAVTRAYQQLTLPLQSGPAQTKDPRGLSLNDAQTGTIQALYSPELWPRLTKGLQELQAGHGDTLLALADDYLQRRANGTYLNQDDAHTAIACVDKPAQKDRDKIGATDTEIRKVAPFLDDGHGTGNGALGACALWPVPPTSNPHSINAPGLPTIVVVSTTGDPATPYQAGVDLAEQLKARLITYEGTQHGATLDDIKCVDDAVYGYLINLTLPPENLRCTGEPAA